MGFLNSITDGLGLTNTKGVGRATDRANAMLEAAKSSAAGLGADAQTLMNPNVQNQVRMATDAAMAQFGGAGNLFNSGAMKAVADRAQDIGSREYNSALDKALAMQQGNAQITAGIGANKIASAQNQSVLGELGSALGGAGSFIKAFS
jgi:hypothetical protein